jgi:predicted nucleotidyltransferase
VKNPNDIVEQYVADYRAVYGDALISIIMYGSAVTHEYVPRRSDINTAIVLSTYDIQNLARCIPLVKKWRKKNVTTPFFMTREYITTSLDSYPVEFIDMRSNYKVLFGEDVLARLDIRKENLRLQCERELKGIALHIRREYVGTGNSGAVLSRLLAASIKRLLPILKGLLVLNNRPIPKLKSEIVLSAEELYNLGGPTLSALYDAAGMVPAGRSFADVFADFAITIDSLISTVNASEFERKQT